MLQLFTGQGDRGKRLDLYLKEQFPNHSRARLQEWIEAGRVRINGAAAKASMALKGSESIEVEPSERPPLKAVAEDLPLAVLYEDAAVIAVNKAAGMVVHAGAGAHSGTLVNALLHRFERLSQSGGALRPGIVHRLDRYTSGIVLVARDDAAHDALSAQFASRSIEKIYLALVHGEVKSDAGHVRTPIARDPSQRVRMTAKLARGRAAHTEYRVLRRFDKFTFLEVRIHTGRTHQIRVHLASVGHPVVGDPLYGAPRNVANMPELGRYFLHAHRVRFVSPDGGKPVTLEAPLPPELERWMNGLL